MISCICPTTPERAWCLPMAIRAFLGQQELPDGAELVLGVSGGEMPAGVVPDDPRIRVLALPDSATLGDKHNLLVEACRNEAIAKWDDDDYHAPWRIARSLRRLHTRRADLVGTRNLYIYDLSAFRLWLYRYDAVVHAFDPEGGRTDGWVSGNALVFHRRVWQRRAFPTRLSGVDTVWIQRAIDAGWSHDYVPDEAVVVMEWGQRTGRKEWRPEPPTYLPIEMDRLMGGGAVEVLPPEFVARFKMAYDRRRVRVVG